MRKCLNQKEQKLQQKLDESWAGALKAAYPVRGSIACKRRGYSRGPYLGRDITTATHESGHAVTAWASGLAVYSIKTRLNLPSPEYRAVVRGRMFGGSLFDNYVGGPIADAMIVAECAKLYGGPVAESRYTRYPLVTTLMTSGQSDHDAIRDYLTLAPLSKIEVLDKEALATARRICTKYRFLINEVAAVLLKNQELYHADFYKIVESHGLAPEGDPNEMLSMGVTALLEARKAHEEASRKCDEVGS